jgi:glycosyltransferase involved in cell wall biosynthesis
MNEGRNIGWVLSRMPAGLHEVILVDGRSMDNTVAVARKACPDIRVINQRARGKGAALAVGLGAVTGDIAVMIDADGSMDPAEIPALVGALLAGADVVKGSRATAGGGSRDLSGLRKAGNRGLTYVANRIYGQSWRELCYGYAAFWTDVLPVLGVPGLAASESTVDRSASIDSRPPIAYGHGFEIEAVLFCRAARARLRVAEVFSFEHARRHGDSNLATWRDGWRVLTAVMKERHFLSDAGIPRHLRSYPVVPELHAAEN